MTTRRVRAGTEVSDAASEYSPQFQVHYLHQSNSDVLLFVLILAGGLSPSNVNQRKFVGSAKQNNRENLNSGGATSTHQMSLIIGDIDHKVMNLKGKLYRLCLWIFELTGVVYRVCRVVPQR
jgi:hypothetical protein